MSNIRGGSFSVRFYRRLAKSAANGYTASANKIEGQNMQNTMFRLMNIWKATMNLPQITNLKLSRPVSQMEVEKVLTAGVGENEKALWMAARNGDCYKIRVLVMQGVDLEARDSQGRTALNIATQYNMGEAIKTLRAAKEMKAMAKFGELPDTKFFQKFTKAKTGSE